MDLLTLSKVMPLMGCLMLGSESFAGEEEVWHAVNDLNSAKAIDAEGYLWGAYALIWLVLLIYVVFINRRSQDILREVERIEKGMDSMEP